LSQTIYRANDYCRFSFSLSRWCFCWDNHVYKDTGEGKDDVEPR
jgi:hypothetical protein